MTMGIDPPGLPVVVPDVVEPATEEPVTPSPVPREDVQPVPPTNAIPATIEVSPSGMADQEMHVFLVSGYVDALKREFDSVHSRAKDAARAVLIEMRLVDEDAFKAFVAAEPKAAAIVTAEGSAPNASSGK